MPSVTPNPAGFQFDVVKDTTTPPGIPSSILPLVVIGYCTDLAVNTPTPFSTPGAVQAAAGEGPAVEHAAGALDGNGGVSLVHVVNVATSTDGAYGAITTSFADANAPTVEADLTTLPEDDFDVEVTFPTGGNLGTAGIKARVSLDKGLHYFAAVALGVSTSITIPNGGGRILLVAPLATLLTRANDIRTKFAAHVAEDGTYHGAVDPGSPYTLTAAVDQATLFTLCGELKTAALAHVVAVAGVHGAADTTAQTAITALAAPTTRSAAQTFLAAFATAFFGDGSTVNSGHTLRTVAAIHLAADNVNVLAALGTIGVITANDTISVATTAPTPDATQIAAAMASLRTYAGSAGTIALSAPITGSMVSAIGAELVELWKLGKFYDLVAPWRRPTLTETAEQYSTALDTDLSGVVLVDMRLLSGAVYHESALINTADGRASPRRPNAWWVSMAAARNEPETYLSFISPQRGVRITDSLGNVLPGCLDESSGSLYSAQNRTGGTKRDLLRDPNGGVFITQDLVLYDVNSDWILGPYSSCINYALRVAAPVVVLASANPSGFPSPASGPLEDEVVKALESTVQSFLDEALKDRNRVFDSQIQITDSSSAQLRWKITNAPNYYVINGVRITAGVVSREI